MPGMIANPFTPTFGGEPLLLVGREQVINDILNGLENGPGDPNRATIFTGPRGSGKTVLISHITFEAAKNGWLSANVTDGDGVAAHILERIEFAAAEFLPKKSQVRLTGIQVSGSGFSFQDAPEQTLSWRGTVQRILEKLEEHDIGLLISIDEVKASSGGLAQIISDFQHFIREKRKVALIMAGLPGNVLQLFKHESISFLRRAYLRKLEPLKPEDVRYAIRKTVELSERRIAKEALELASESTRGFPFMIQLVGYHMWRQSEKKMISTADAEEGIREAYDVLERTVFEATLGDVSDTDIRFLKAMAVDDAESEISLIAKRMNVSTNYAGLYRHRMIEQGIIEPVRRGKVNFAMPMIREYLRKL